MDNEYDHKISMEMERIESADVHLYANVEKKDENTEGLYTELTNRTKIPQSIYSDIQPGKKSNSLLASKSSSYLEPVDKRNDKHKKSRITISWYWLCLTIMSQLLLLLITIISGVVIIYTRASNNSGPNQEYFKLSNEEFMKSISSKLEYIGNMTLNNSLMICAIFNDFNQLNRSNSLEYAVQNEKINQLNYAYDINITNLMDLVIDRDLHLEDLVNQLNTSTSNEYASLNKRINQINHLGTMYLPAPSCRAIHIFQPYSLSGYYWVSSVDGSSIRVYCEMTKSCGNVTGGLTRVALLNDETRPLMCTGDFVTVHDSDTRCIRNTEEPGCSHMVFPLMNMSYSHICGTVEGYWFGSPDGFSRPNDTTINDNYVDGISLTYGNISNRTHIWTFIADGIINRKQNCPKQIPEYVEIRYSCLISANLCPSTTNPCSHEIFRHFQRALTEDIEMRLCRDQHRRRAEGIYFGNLEILVL